MAEGAGLYRSEFLFLIRNDFPSEEEQFLIYRRLLEQMEDVDFFIFHQANKVLIDYMMDKLRIPKDKTFTNVEEIGNTGAASIGIAFDEAMTNNLIKPGDTVMFIGVGAGFNFGANLWKV